MTNVQTADGRENGARALEYARKKRVEKEAVQAAMDDIDGMEREGTLLANNVEMKVRDKRSIDEIQRDIERRNREEGRPRGGGNVNGHANVKIEEETKENYKRVKVEDK